HERMLDAAEVIRQHRDLEQGALGPAEYKAHAEHERERQQQREDERAAITQELEVARMPDREQAPDHGRSSLPVSSRNRSSRLGGRMRRLRSGTWTAISALSVWSMSSVVISTRSVPSITRNGNARAAGVKSARGNSISTSAKWLDTSSRGEPWAMMRPRSMIAISSQSR